MQLKGLTLYFIITFVVVSLFVSTTIYSSEGSLVELLFAGKIFLIIGFILIISPILRPKVYLTVGLLVFTFSFYAAFSNILDLVRSSLMMWLVGGFLLFDGLNYILFGSSLISSVKRGKYNEILGIIISTIFFATIMEIVNLPFKFWVYNPPVPTPWIMGIPLGTYFGWFLWLLILWGGVNFFIKSIQKYFK